ncbi:23S rRNA (adenine(1618)-N(6))-methyltransferase RlmF [Parashewanella tropica]|uniref:23S rRNA (adenine(1618)-N(6))-methyltransferase RlmF n=1 Tax=Parashewanella tropica TaxID=2547970 RepID=UPI00105971FE|nr:23S rRNA (adenine(1618)-N(6))-methyltransferase RlmF [Parashewanella tropica]
MPSSVPSSSSSKGKLHPRNRHNKSYDFEALVTVFPELKAKLITTPRGEMSINFSDPISVKLLNKALLISDYGIQFWELAEGYLCPPIPGRVDMLHYIADLLAQTYQLPVKKLKQRAIKGLDIGCGANLIYPLLGQSVYGWQFVGSDIHKPSIKASDMLIKANGLGKQIECRWQPKSQHIFHGIIKEGEFYDFTLCNPPFHKSAEEAQAGSLRKQANLNKSKQVRGSQLKPDNNPLNFAGQHNELWCDGGESAFIRRMINESRHYAEQCRWFTSLVAKKENLPVIKKALKKAQVVEYKVINMSQGQKISRMVCWSFKKPSA